LKFGKFALERGALALCRFNCKERPFAIEVLAGASGNRGRSLTVGSSPAIE
jgi:hypothetical protein